jgi:hypothetical protein
MTWLASPATREETCALEGSVASFRSTPARVQIGVDTGVALGERGERERT